VGVHGPCLDSLCDSRFTVAKLRSMWPLQATFTLLDRNHLGATPGGVKNGIGAPA
jgi:hypothetical protein